MGTSPGFAHPAPGREPWFNRRPHLALAVALFMFGCIFALQLVSARADASVLYTLPVALVALAFGLRHGTLAGGVAAVLMVTGNLLSNETLSVVSWFSHLAPLLLLGSLVGESADRIRAAREAERYAMSVALLQRDAAEVNDSVVQGLAATKWLLESGQVEPAIEALDETAEVAQGLVSRILGRDSLLPSHLRNPHQVIRPSTGD